MVFIDGSLGEGGGQILRTSLALSLFTGKPFRMVNIRAKRRKPGLLRQHVTAIRAATAIGKANVTGDEVASTELLFIPDEVVPGDYEFSIRTAGSTNLVLQTILPPLMVAAGASTLRLEGGTHNPQAPPYEFLQRTFLPVIRSMGPNVRTVLERPGFYPAGGGILRVTIEPQTHLEPIELMERGAHRGQEVIAMIAHLPLHIAERELEFIHKGLQWPMENFKIMEVEDSIGPGNVLLVMIDYSNLTEVFAAFGERRVPAEKVAARVLDETLVYLNSSAAVCMHLADQLLVPFAMAGAGAFRTLPLSSHSRTNLEVIQKFLDVKVTVIEDAHDVSTVRF